MKRYVFIIFLTISASLSASVNQRGQVKTIARPNKPSTELQGAIIRIRGSHNAVESQQDGSFNILLNNHENGQPFSVASVILSNYTLAEQELIGKQIACSEFVTLDILMVNRQQLEQEKEQIAQKARENVEIYYQKKLKVLEKQLQDKQIQESEFKRLLGELEEKYEKFEPLIETMADKYARTDINKLDSLSQQINEAIEQGDLDKAEILIHKKGSIDKREQELKELELQNKRTEQLIEQASVKLKQQQQLADSKKRELAEDFYRLYSIALSRFENDSAAYYIRKRAGIDTLNFDYQLQAGEFMKEIMADLNAAQTYILKAKNIAEQQYQPESTQNATVLHELASLYQKQSKLDEALVLYRQSLEIRKQLHGDKSMSVAQTLNNMGELYRQKGDLRTARQLHQEALEIRKADNPNSMEIAESLNNLASVMFFSKDYAQAEDMFNEALEIYKNTPNTPLKQVATVENNLASIYFITNRIDKAVYMFEQAYNTYKKILPADHPTTKTVKQNLDFCIEQSKQNKQ